MNQHRNSKITFRRTHCAATVAMMATFGAYSAHAQQAAAPASAASAPTPSKPAAAADTPIAKIDTVVISGTRQSISSAIERKRNAATVTDSIVAEDIGQFPDKNVGEALSRITGVQLSRDYGEGSQVAIRGVDPDLNRIEVNGMSVLSTNNTAGRGAELRELPAELIKSVDVYKGVTADLTEGGIGGTVKIRTNKPLDFKKFTLVGNLSGQKNTLRDGIQPRASVLIADRFFNGNLGLMANVTYDEAFTQGDSVRNTGWRFLRDWDFSPEKTVTSLNTAAAAVPTKSGCAALATSADRTACDRQWFDYSPSIPRYVMGQRDHKRLSAEFTAQYQMSKELSAYVSHQRNKQNARFRDLTYGGEFANVNRLSNANTLPRYNADGSVAAAGTCTPVSTTATPAGMTVTNHHVTEYTVGNCMAVAGQGGAGAFSTTARDFAQRVNSEYNSGGFEWRKGAWNVEGMLAKTAASYANDSNFLGLGQAAPGLKMSFDAEGRPHYTFPTAWDPNKSSSYTSVTFNYRPTESESTEDQRKIDISYRTDLPFLKRIMFGGQARKSRQLQYNGGGYLLSNGSNLASTADDLDVKSANVTQVWNWDPLFTGVTTRPPATQSFINSNNSEIWVTSQQMQQFVDMVRATSPDFLKGSGVGGYPTNWMMPGYQAAAASGLFDMSKYNHDEVRQALGRDGNIYPQVPAYDTAERVKAAYVRLDFDQELGGMDFEGNVGVRYTATRTASTGVQQLRRRIARTPTGTTYDDRVITNSIVTKHAEYSDVLPSFNLAAWLLPSELVARVGFGKVMTRPDINLLSPAINCLENGANPQFGGDGYDDCTAGNPELKPYRATNKDLSIEWYPNRDSQLSLAYFQKDIRTAIMPSVVVRKDLFGDGKLYDVTTTVNYDGATTKGIELAGRTALTWLPGFMSGLGIDASYTRMNYKYAPGDAILNTLDGTELSFPGMSKNSYNVSLWYDQGKFNARIAYNYRDPYYSGNTDSATGNPVFVEKTGYLDAKVQYRFTPNLTFSLEAKNLTDQITQTTAGSSERKNDMGWYGRRYYVGVGYKF